MLLDLKTYPNDPRILYHLAQTYALVNKPKDSILTYLKIVKILSNAKRPLILSGAGIRAAGAAGRRAAHKQAEAARIDYRETLHNGAWRGWGGLSPSERAETGARTASNHWATDVDDTDGWTEHVIDSHLDLIPASQLHLLPRMGHYYGQGDYGDARE